MTICQNTGRSSLCRIHTKLVHAGPTLKAFCLHLVAPLLIGSLIYLLWRPSTLLVFAWLDVVGLEKPVQWVRAFSLPVLPDIPSWIVYSLPNGVWAYAFTSSMCLVWRGKATGCSGIRFFWISLGPMLGIGSEISQLFGAVPGVFDRLDLILLSLASMAGLQHLRLSSGSRVQ